MQMFLGGEISPSAHLEMRFDRERLQLCVFSFFILFFFCFLGTDLLVVNMEFDSDTDIVLRITGHSGKVNILVNSI